MSVVAEPKARSVWTPHPVIRMPTRDQLLGIVERLGPEAGKAEIARIHAMRERSIQLSAIDPLHYGYEPDPWKVVRRLIAEGFDEIGILGANREGKTEIVAKLGVEDMVQRKAEWAFFHNTETTSINQQQSRVFKFFPPEWRALATKGNGLRDNGAYIAYKAATGFTNQKFIFPGTGSTGYFWNYLQRSEVWEGPEYDGMWFDERVTLPILETARYRLGRDRRLLRLITFTPKWGFSPVVQNLVAGATIVETRPALLLDQARVHVKGCPPGHMPYVLHCARPKSAVVFFHNQMNPMGAGKEVAQALIGAPTARIYIRGYGWAEKSEKSAFPKFGPAHQCTREQFDKMAAKGVTRYCVMDPGSMAKNAFIKWYAVTPAGHTIVYREWPDMQRYEEWARSPAELDEDQEQSVGRKYDWRPGPAQRMEKGRGMADYRRLILEAEGWVWDKEKRWWTGPKGGAGWRPRYEADFPGIEETPAGVERIERRLIDPRAGGTGIVNQEEGTSVIDLLAEPVVAADGVCEVPGMVWEPAPASGVREGGQLIEDAMAWDEDSPKTIENCPKWYVVDDCKQSILAYQEFTGLGTLKDALKDIVDPDRYFIKAGYGYVEPEMFRVRRACYY